MPWNETGRLAPASERWVAFAGGCCEPNGRRARLDESKRPVRLSYPFETTGRTACRGDARQTGRGPGGRVPAGCRWFGGCRSTARGTGIWRQTKPSGTRRATSGRRHRARRSDRRRAPRSISAPARSCPSRSGTRRSGANAWNSNANTPPFADWAVRAKGADGILARRGASSCLSGPHGRGAAGAGRVCGACRPGGRHGCALACSRAPRRPSHAPAPRPSAPPWGLPSRKRTNGTRPGPSRTKA